MLAFLLRHTAVRRTCSFAFLSLLCILTIALLPLAALVGGLDILVRGRARAARFAAFAGVYLWAEFTGLCDALRVRGSDQDAHYALLNRRLAALFRTARRVFRLRVAAPDQGLALPDGPLLVFSRHAGPGDSFLLAYALLALARRRPRLVLKESLKLDPLIDVVLGRTPNCFVGLDAQARAEAVGRIGRLSASLGAHDALLLFPEGGNFTTARRRRLISRMLRRRAWRELPTAASLNHVLPALPSGALSAVDAAPPGATVVFVAHTGLDRMETVAETWRSVPLDQPVRVAWWTVPVSEVPAGEHTRRIWLEEHWARIDAWIDRHAAAQAGTNAEETHETGREGHTALDRMGPRKEYRDERDGQAA